MEYVACPDAFKYNLVLNRPYRCGLFILDVPPYGLLFRPQLLHELGDFFVVRIDFKHVAPEFAGPRVVI